jgi:hypothetical protein
MSMRYFPYSQKLSSTVWTSQIEYGQRRNSMSRGIKGDVKREHFTSSSVRISFGIQPLIAARCCCFWRLAIQRIPDHTTFVAITITSRAAVGCRTWRRTESEIAEQDHRWGRCRQPSPGDRS